MESSNIHGGEEECSSSESGWTTYLASSIHGTDDDDNNNSSSERIRCKSYQNQYVEDGESDDSMASDASSGPSHQGNHPCRIPVRSSHGYGDCKNVRGGRDNRKDLSKEHSKRAEKTKSTKEEPGHKGKSLIGNAFSRGKFRKSK